MNRAAPTIAMKEMRLLFKSKRRIFLLFGVPIGIVLIILFLYVMIIVVASTSTTSAVSVIFMNEDAGVLGDRIYSDFIHSGLILEIQNETYSQTSVAIHLEKMNFDIMIHIPANFTATAMSINQTAILEIYYDNSKLNNEATVAQLYQIVNNLNNELIIYHYGYINFNQVNVTIHGQSQGIGALAASILSMIPLYLIIFLVLPPMSLLLISVTMEREQKTLEALLTQPIPRSSIVFGKLLYGVILILINFIADTLTLIVMAFVSIVIIGPYMPSADELTEVDPDFALFTQLGSIELSNELIFIISYIIVNMILIAFLMVTLAVFLSFMAKDEREGNLTFSLIFIIPIFSSLFLFIIPVMQLPLGFQLFFASLPLIGFFYSVYAIAILGELSIPIIWASISQFLWLILITKLTAMIAESEGILDISYKKLLFKAFKR